MSKWQKISIALAGLLLLSCFALTAIGALWFVNGGGRSTLAALTGVTPTPTLPPAALGTNPVAPRGSNGPGRNGLAGMGGAFGTVSSVNGSQLTVAAANGQTRTFNVGTQTRVIVVGVANPTVADIKAGDRLLVIGARAGNNSLEPRGVVAVPGTYNQSNIRLGQVQSVSGSTLTVLTQQGTVNVTTDANTQVMGLNLQPTSLSQAANANVLIVGQPGSNGSFSAQLILGQAAPRGGRTLPGATPTPLVQ